MSTTGSAAADDGWTLKKGLIFAVAIVGIGGTWVLFLTAPPTGTVSPYGIAISIIAGAYILYLISSYVKPGS